MSLCEGLQNQEDTSAVTCRHITSGVQHIRASKVLGVALLWHKHKISWVGVLLLKEQNNCREDPTMNSGAILTALHFKQHTVVPLTNNLLSGDSPTAVMLHL